MKREKQKLIQHQVQKSNKLKNKNRITKPLMIVGVSSLFAVGLQTASANAAQTNTGSENTAATALAMTSDNTIQQAVTNNIKDSVTLSQSYIKNAVSPGPFTAGVNQVIPFEAFGGDGMLTRLLLKSSDSAPWSDNGSKKNAALAPADGLQNGQYFYEVDLDGNAAGKTDASLLNTLKNSASKSYKAMVKVYAAKDGKADTSQVVGQKTVTINVATDIQKAVNDNIKDNVTIPANYAKNAVSPGPFTAGVNQVIPFEAFGGDGMLTRLLLKASDSAPWSDNGSKKNAALAPAADLQNGQYFYEVDLDGNAAGKMDASLLNTLKESTGKAYNATVKVYAAKDGKADTSQVVGQKKVMVNLAKASAPVDQGVALYRVYNPNSGEHMYTANQNEFKMLVKAGWHDEGHAWTAATSGTAIYRLYNPNSGEHFYTANIGEYNSVAKAGWNKENIAFYSDAHKGTPIYRSFNPNAKGAGSHLFTPNTGEKNHLKGLGWHDEGIAFYGIK